MVLFEPVQVGDTDVSTLADAALWQQQRDARSRLLATVTDEVRYGTMPDAQEVERLRSVVAGCWREIDSRGLWEPGGPFYVTPRHCRVS